ncbi:MAG: hypothetical protein ACE3JK_16645 [Sporolactobacillus sp.]
MDNQSDRKPVKVIFYSDNMRVGQFAAAKIVPILSQLGFIVLPALTLISKIDTNFTEEGKFQETAPSTAYYKTYLE